MTEGSVAGAALPGLSEALGWIGFQVDAVGGERVGNVRAVFADAEGGAPTWLIAGLPRGGLLRRGTDLVAIPLRDCAGATGRVWTAHERGALGSAPTVDPTRPLLREHELTICAHYGIGERVGRAAEVTGRAEGAVTSQPAS